MTAQRDLRQSQARGAAAGAAAAAAQAAVGDGLEAAPERQQRLKEFGSHRGPGSVCSRASSRSRTSKTSGPASSKGGEIDGEEAEITMPPSAQGGPDTPIAPWNQVADVQALADRAAEATLQEVQARGAGPWRRRSSSGKPHSEIGPYVAQTVHDEEAPSSPTAGMAQLHKQTPQKSEAPHSQAWLEDPRRPIGPLTKGQVQIRRSLGLQAGDTQEPASPNEGPPAQGSTSRESQSYVAKESLDHVTGTILGALNAGFGEIKRVQLQQQEQIRTLDENARAEASKRNQQMFDLETKFEAMKMRT